LGLECNVVVPTSDEFRLHLENQKLLKAKIVDATNVATQKLLTQYNISSDNVDPRPIIILPSKSNDDRDATIKQDIPSSSDTSSVILTVQIDPIETPLEWSARMKRYQQEEIQFLGLDIIKPQISLPQPQQPQPPVIKKLPAVQNVRPDRSDCQIKIATRNNMVLSKQRFEEWLDTLHPRASPGISVSQPATIANSDTSLNCALENDRVCKWLPSPDDGSMSGNTHGIPLLDANTFNGCGRSIWSETTSRNWGVQTDITGCLIII